MLDHKNNNICSCPNGYETKEIFLENFGNDESLEMCSSCDKFKNSCGTYYCDKFSSNKAMEEK